MLVYTQSLTLQISNQNAHNLSEDEVFHEERDEGEGHTEHCQKKVAQRQVQEEHVGHRAHLLVLDYRHDHQDVAYQRQQENDHVEGDLDVHA